MSQILEARLMAKVAMEPNSGCWIWTGADDGSDGYGRIVVGGKQRSAHRVSYELFCQPIPQDKHIDHLCRVRCCVNPRHLEAVSCAENIRRGETGKNQHREVCKRGHRFDEHGYVRQGSRQCRLCTRIRSNAYYARTKVAV